MKSQKKYKAFSLIELIIAIVVIGVIVTTIPIILSTFISSARVSSKEEVFFSQFSLLSLINTKYFDENNTINDNQYKDLNATDGDKELLINYYSSNVGYSRIGKFQINNNILRSGSKEIVSKIGTDINESDVNNYDDIDDFNGYKEHIEYGVQKGGYDINVSVFYIKDEANYSSNKISFKFDIKNVSNFTNIKVIKLTTTLNDGSKILLLYPTSNIGASKMLSLEEIEK